MIFPERNSQKVIHDLQKIHISQVMNWFLVIQIMIHLQKMAKKWFVISIWFVIRPFTKVK